VSSEKRCEDEKRSAIVIRAEYEAYPERRGEQGCQIPGRPLRPKLTATWRPFTATLIDTSVGPFLTVKK